MTNGRTSARRASRHRGWLAVSVFLVFCACQAVFGFLGGGDDGPRFPHAVHLEELDCSACHDGSEDRADAGFPATEKGCMLCHEELDQGKPLEQTVASFLVEGRPIWLNQVASYGGEVRFDHGAHFEAEVDCESCHGSQTDTDGPDLRLHGGKTTCMECHADTPRGNDCSVCHESMRFDVAPPDHSQMWRRAHGPHSREMLTGTGDTTCAQCHSQSSCNDCHQVEEPDNHSNFWRRRGHGLTAALDRSNCAVCHQTDSCDRCHRTTEPMSHRGSFGPPANRHCVSCHQSGAGLGCAACHTNFPAHPPGQGVPLNPAHMTARSPGDCLACHVGLSHAVPAGDCRACHR